MRGRYRFRGPESPVLLTRKKRMIDKRNIAVIVEEFIEGSEFFLVDVRVSSTSKITVLFDRRTGGLTVDDCARLSRFIEGRLDRDKEDYELQVSSPGLEMPLLVPEQFVKNQGRSVEVTDADGNKSTGVLRNVTSGGFEISTPVLEKKKIVGEKDLSFNFSDVKSVKIVIAFK